MHTTTRFLLLAAVPAIVTSLGGARPALAQTTADDRTALTRGVPAVYAPGALVGTLIVFDDTKAFTVLSGREDRSRAPIVAAARAGTGRVVAYAHNGFLEAGSLREAGTATLMANSVRWSGNKANGPVRVGVLGQDEADAALKSAGFTVASLKPSDLGSQLGGIDVLVLNPGSIGAKADIEAIQAWVRGGGGLVTYGVGWGWKEENPTLQLPDASFNRLLIPLAGIGFGGGTTDPTGPKGAFLVDGVGLDSGDASAALALLEKVSSGQTKPTKAELGSISRTLAEATDVLPDDDLTFMPRLKAVLAKYGSAPDGAVIPTKSSPVGLDKPAARIAAVLEARELARTPLDRIRANPAAASFPGAVAPDATRLPAQTISVDMAVPDWHSTGLYEAPGEIVTVTLPPDAAGKGLGVRIGSHSDELWNVDFWWRFPKVTVEQTIPGTSLRIANAFGGTVYITVPDDKKVAGLGTVSVTVAGAVAQPYFVKGKTSVADWKATIRNNPAPWAELQGDNVILSVPSYAVRNLDDPEALMTYWDKVADTAADLYDIPHKRKRQERYCTDVQISAGYMHSGYPIMTFDDVARTFTNLAILRGPDGLKTWGFYHELGHNHQQEDWTWDGMGEVTNNLLSLLGDETFNGVKPDYEHSHPAIAPKLRRDRLISYLAKVPIPDGETADPWLALTMFIDLRQEFGWTPFSTVFGEYRTLTADERPKTETDKHDQFMVRFSKAIGKNLGPYFTAWGLTTSPAARHSIASLPMWMPADWPTAQEIAQAKADPKRVNNYGY